METNSCKGVWTKLALQLLAVTPFHDIPWVVNCGRCCCQSWGASWGPDCGRHTNIPKFEVTDNHQHLLLSAQALFVVIILLKSDVSGNRKNLFLWDFQWPWKPASWQRYKQPNEWWIFLPNILVLFDWKRGSTHKVKDSRDHRYFMGFQNYWFVVQNIFKSRLKSKNVQMCFIYICFYPVDYNFFSWPDKH